MSHRNLGLKVLETEEPDLLPNIEMILSTEKVITAAAILELSRVSCCPLSAICAGKYDALSLFLSSQKGRRWIAI